MAKDNHQTIEAYIFVSGRDVFVTAQTGAGKSLTFEPASSLSTAMTSPVLLISHRSGLKIQFQFPLHRR